VESRQGRGEGDAEAGVLSVEDPQESPQSPPPAQRTRAIERGWHEAYFRALALTGVVSAAAKVAGVDRSTVLNTRKREAEFAEREEDARQQAIDRLEEEARRRAFAGYEEPVYQGGQLVGHRQRYSDDLAKFLLDRQRYPRSIVVETGEAAKDTAARIVDAVRAMRGTVPGDGEAAP